MLRELTLCTIVVCFSNYFINNYNIQLLWHYVIPSSPAILTTSELTFFTLVAFLYV